MKTLKDLEYTGNTTIGGFMEQIKVMAMLILKTNKEINTADWIEFFNIEKEFADECLTKPDVDQKDGESGSKNDN